MSALLQLPGLPSSAPVWLQWLAYAAAFLLVAGAAGLYLWMFRRKTGQEIHNTTVADLNAALNAKDKTIARLNEEHAAELARMREERDEAREALKDVSVEYEGVSGINTTLWLAAAKEGFQARFEDMARQIEVLERDNARQAREARDAKALLAEGRKDGHV